MQYYNAGCLSMYFITDQDSNNDKDLTFPALRPEGEEVAKAFVTGRKNWLFSDSVDGAEASALTYSMVETAKANDVDVYYYLKYLLMKCPTALTSDDDLERLCPWNPECKEALDELHRQHQKAIFDAM